MEDKTIQINIRITKSLAREIEDVSSMLKISRTDWIRQAIARNALEEHRRMLAEIGELEKLMDSHMKSILRRMTRRS